MGRRTYWIVVGDGDMIGCINGCSKANLQATAVLKVCMLAFRVMVLIAVEGELSGSD